MSYKKGERSVDTTSTIEQTEEPVEEALENGLLTEDEAERIIGGDQVWQRD